MSAPITRRVPEKVVQRQIVHALRSVGATVYVIGRPPLKTDTHKGTRQTPGIPDLLVHLPGRPGCDPPHQVWIEVKAKGGRLSEEQRSFRDFCLLSGIPHLVGGLDEVYAYLLQHGYVREVPHYRLPSGAPQGER